LTVVPPRKTLQGSYRLPTPRHRPLITINSNLNPYAFLLTLLHEIAHAQAFKTYKTKGHQKEWKNCFKHLLTVFMEMDVFPADIQLALKQHLEKISYSDSTDIKLTKILRQYDNNAASDSKTIALYEIPKNTVFLHEGKIFQKGEPLRKYILCKNMTNKKMYRCHPLMKVSVLEEKIL
jgi:hypothetical protein